MKRTWEIRELFSLSNGCPFCTERLQQSLLERHPGCRTEVRTGVLVVESEGDLSPEVQALSRALSARFGHLHGTVEGADCPSCAGKMQRALERGPGVRKVQFQPLTKQLLVEFELGLGKPDALRDSLKNLGFEFRETQPAGSEPSGCCCSSAGCSSGRLPQATDDKPRPTGGRLRALANDKALRPALVAGTAVLAAYGTDALLSGVQHWPYWTAAVAAGWGVARGALHDLRAREPFTIQTLMTVAAVGAFFIGAAEEALMVLFLFAIGEYLEVLATSRARASIASLLNLAPREATLCAPTGSLIVPVDSLREGDVIEVRAGMRIPTDGDVVAGTSHADESLLTGESVPVAKSVGDAVVAGTLNADGLLRLRVTRTAADNTLSRIIRMVEQAQERRAPIARFIDRFARWYTPAIFAAGTLTALLPPLFLAETSWSTWIYRALGLLLIGCPCALVLSVPTAITAAIANGARRGLLIKGGASLELIGRVHTVAFDKTGTLTEGHPTLTDIEAFEGLTPDDVVRLAHAIEAGSQHPLANAVRRHAEAHGLAPLAATGHQAIAGQGIRAFLGENDMAILAPRSVPSANIGFAKLQESVTGLEAQGKTVVALVDSTRSLILGALAFRDELRRDSKQALALLSGMGVRPVMLTGDNGRVARALAGELGIDFHAELLPQMKLDRIEDLKRVGTTAMVGDGINDAPALAAAHVGIAMGQGADVAIETADAVLSRTSLVPVANLVALSRSTLGVIRQNVAVALALKGAFLLTTLMGVTGLWPAVMADTGATVLVTLNSLRLLGRAGPESH